MEASGSVCIEAERALEGSAYAFINTRTDTWTSITGTSGNALECTADDGNNWTSSTDLNTNHPEITLKIKFATAGSYKVWLLFKTADAAEDSCFVGYDDAYKFMYDFADSSNWAWVNAGTISSVTTGYHTFHIWAREDGFMVDKVYLTIGTTTPTGTGPAESSRE